jgi:D-lyxose ketol-isomerase
MMRSFGFVMPPFAYWSPDEFKARKDIAKNVIDTRCGWDITDYGAGKYDEMGLFLFTLRNGRLADLQRGGGMCYAEKLLTSKQDQLSPMHTHVLKAEDIINRGGATLVVELYGSDTNSNFDTTAGGRVFYDGIERSFSAGEKLRLAPGESVTLMPCDWHAFWGDGGDVLIAKVLHWAHNTGLHTLALCHGPAALLAAKSDAGFLYGGYKITVFPDAVDKQTPMIGYLPGPMP